MKQLVFLILISSMLFAGCRKDQLNDCFQGTGADKTETRFPGSFTKIKIGENFDIKLTQDTTLPEAVTITCGKNIIGQIVSKVKNSTLTIENKNTCNFVRSYDRKVTIEIRVRFIDDIEIFSVSNLHSDDTIFFKNRPNEAIKIKNFGLGDINLKVFTGFLELRSINSGNIILEGRSNILGCSIEEVTTLDARNLDCDDVYIDLHSPLDCYVNARNILVAKIFNDGNVYYLKTPSVKLELAAKEGNGNLIKM